MHDQLLVNVPMLLRLATQKPLNLYSIDTVPMPFDTETLDGKNNEYTFINNSYPYMALNEHNYIPLTETQLRMCDKMGSTYYCQNSYVSLRLRVQNRRKKWNFPLNFRTMRKLSDLYSRIFQTQSSGCASGVNYFRNFTKLKNLNF